MAGLFVPLMVFVVVPALARLFRPLALPVSRLHDLAPRTPSSDSPLPHVGLLAHDLDGTLRFYTEALGFGVRRTWSLPAAGIHRAGRPRAVRARPVVPVTPPHAPPSVPDPVGGAAAGGVASGSGAVERPARRLGARRVEWRRPPHPPRPCRVAFSPSRSRSRS